MSTIITNVAVVTMNETHEVIQRGFAAWKGGEITAVGTMDKLEALIAEERTMKRTMKQGKVSV